MKATITFDFGRGKTTFDFEFDRMELTDGKGIQFFGVKDPDGAIDKVVDENWLRKKFFYQTDLFGERFAYVAYKDICSLKVK